MKKNINPENKQKKIDNNVNQIKIAELENSLKRTLADFDNFRKKCDAQRSSLISEANIDLIIKILPVMDNFKRARLHVPENLKNSDWVIGALMIESQLENILNEEGLIKIEVSPGDEFNPQIHEAISHESNNKYPDNKIIDKIENGYRLNNKIIKPVKVRVSKGNQ